jgi:uncharacterized membrane protein
MTEEPILNETEVTNDDRLFAALAYVFSPLVPIIILFLEDKKDRPFIKSHNVQALVAGLLLGILVSFLTIITCGLGVVSVFGWVIMCYWAYRAYQGEYVNIPVITDFVKGQGWA